MEKPLTLYQQGNRLFVKEKHEEAIELFLQHAHTHPNDAADAYVQIANCFRRMNTVTTPRQIAPGITVVGHGNRETAEVYYKKALELDPRHLGALLGLGKVAHDRRERIRCLHEATKIQPSVLPLLDLGDLCREERDDQRAYEAYKKGLEVGPRETSLYDRLANVCKRLGREDEAMEWRSKKPHR